ncbi:MAG: hypothetical protein NTV24_04485 [Candidatus Woesebacteria bacterium]|nr:hypothetical protein [Candidatus Woesebacteria bacterium]
MVNLKDTGLRILARVLDENLWHKNDEKGETLFDTKSRLTNKDRVLEIAKEEVHPESLVEPDISLPLTEKLNEICEESVNLFIQEALGSGLLTRDVVDTTLLLTNPTDIEVGSVSFGGGINLDLRYHKMDFPGKDEERPHLIISPTIVKTRVERFSKILNELTPINSEQLVSISLGSVAVHEWSHSIEQALGIKYFHNIEKSPEYFKKDDFLYKSGLANSLIFNFSREELNEFLKLREGAGIADTDWSMFALDVKSILKEANFDNSFIPSLLHDLGYTSPYSKGELEELLRLSWAEIMHPSLN